jgi:hypothetical protein
MSEEKKWKRGDIGPDGRVFWKYDKRLANVEQWVDIDRFRQLLQKRKEIDCRYRQKNHGKVTQTKRRYRQENREKVKHGDLRYKQENREKVLQNARIHYQENREKITAGLRRIGLKKTLQKASPKTLQEFYNSLSKPYHTLAAILSLTPDEGQTLAELIHELSGYPMGLCEQIANPPEPEPEPTPEPKPPPVILPDLF